MDILSDIIRQSFLIFLWVGSIAGILVGAGIWLKPQRIILLNQFFSRWVNSDKFGKLLDQPHRTERFFYRHNKLVGAGILIGALIVLHTFLFNYNLRTISSLVPSSYWWFSDALVGIILVGSTLASVIGAIVLFKPSLLRELEQSANQWISTDRLLALSNQMNFSAEQSIIRHHRIAGVCILLGSLYVLVVLGYFILQGVHKL